MLKNIMNFVDISSFYQFFDNLLRYFAHLIFLQLGGLNPNQKIQLATWPTIGPLAFYNMFRTKHI